MLSALVFVAFCALWRVWDGGDHAPGSLSGRGGFRVAVLVVSLLAYLIPALFPVAGWWSILWAVGLGAGPAVAILRGFNDWTEYRTIKHFRHAALTPVVAFAAHSLGVLPMPFYATVAYIGLVLIAGATYPLVHNTFIRFFSGRGHFPRKLCEAVAGAAVLGGISLFV